MKKSTPLPPNPILSAAKAARSCRFGAGGGEGAGADAVLCGVGGGGRAGVAGKGGGADADAVLSGVGVVDRLAALNAVAGDGLVRWRGRGRVLWGAAGRTA